MPLQPNLFDEPATNDKNTTLLEINIEPIPIQKDQPKISFVELIPQKGVVRFIRTYEIQSIHLSKILKILDQKQKQGLKIIQKDIAEELSISLQRTQVTLSLMNKSKLIDYHNKLTLFGDIVLKNCPFIDDPGLLTLFHYFLASDANLIIWSHLFNNLFFGKAEWKRSEIIEEFMVLSGRLTGTTIRKLIHEEIKGVLSSYTDGFLKNLGYINWSEDEITTELDTMTVHPLIWLSAILIYRDRYYPNTPSLEIPLILDSNYCPARIFRQNQIAAHKALDELHKKGFLTIETRSGLDQVRFKKGVTWLSTVNEYFKESGND